MAMTAKDLRGLIHGISPIGGSEHTLCGLAYCFGFDSEESESNWTETKKDEPVTCEMCASVIMIAKKMRVKK